MSKRSTELSRWLLLAGLLCCSSCQSVPSSFENKTGAQNDSRPRIFSPRMDYDEWTPLGRGDPLKNNPTFDYVPPVLDRVQYWLDSHQQHTTEPSSKRDILVLGVTAKKTSPKIPEQFLKFVDGPKFTRVGGQDPTIYRNDFTGSSGAEPPKILRTTSFRNGLLVDYRNQNRLQSPANYYPNPYYSQKIKPYTMMMPPPIQKIETSTGFNVGASRDKIIGYADAPQSFNTQTEEGPVHQDAQYYGHYSPAPSPRPYSTSKAPPSKVETIKSVYIPPASQSTKSKYEATTAPSVSFEKSNLIYQSTQTLSGGWLGNNEPTSSSTPGLPLEVNQLLWQTTDYSKDHYEDHHAAASSNHEVVVGQNANIIVDGSNNENEEVVVGQKEVSTEATSSSTSSSTSESDAQTFTVSTTVDSTEREEETATDMQSSSKMHIVVANSPSTIVDLETHKAKKDPVAVVVPTNYIEKNSSSESATTLHAWENPATSEMTKTTYQASKSQVKPMKTTVTISTEDQTSASSVPNRIISPSQLTPHQFPHSFSHLPVSLNNYNFPDSPTFPSAKHPQMNYPMLHLMGMYPTLRPHLSPPMARLQAIKEIMANMEQDHQQPPQSFPVTITSPPSIINAQTTGSDERSSVMTIDHRPSRLSATVVNSMTTSPPFTPTISSTAEYTPTMNHRQESTRPNQSPLVKILNAEEITRMSTTFAPSSTIPPRTTMAPSLTTDPIFSHYKQPVKPIRGPMYLIIQGHSKVKTYKPTINKHGVPVENNEIVESATERQLSKLEQLIRENTKNGAVDLAAEKKKLEEERARAQEKRVSSHQEDSLMSLVESGLSGFTVSPSMEDERRASNSVASIEIN
ncbi:flocculation protein FLO11 [Nylanderia fulva]|uniref:flocculation protein FLO11 n=1 Tax=Nylanderia fulva TaxID=613905 RepID=UPI0010FAE171|nr:flocculation protein FLO11 [Nylanderia fulva]